MINVGVMCLLVGVVVVVNYGFVGSVGEVYVGGECGEVVEYFWMYVV